MEHNPFTSLLIITGLALFIPIILSRFRRLRLPIVVGEILAGVIIGTSGLNLVESSPILDFLAEFGFAFLMFLSGLEVDFSLLIPRGAQQEISMRERLTLPLPLALGMLALTITLGALAGLLLTHTGMISSPLLMGLILSTTSLGIVAPVLKEKQLLNNTYGQMMLVAASIADFVTLLLLTIVIAAESQGLTLDLLLIPALLALFVLAARLGQMMSRIRALNNLLDELSYATAQIRVRGAFALMVTWVVLAEAAGVEVILGAFLAGAIAGLIQQNDDTDAQEKLDAVGYGFFIPIFFIMVGAELDLRTVAGSLEALLLIPELLIIAYVVKLVPALLLRLRFTWRETLAGGTLLSARLSLIIAASAIAVRIGAISPQVESDIVVMAIVTTSVSPLLFNRIFPHEDDIKREGVIVVGASQMTELLASRMKGNVTVVSRDPGALALLAESGYQTCHGSGADEQTLQAAGAATAEALVVLSTDTVLETSTLARSVFGIPTVVASVNDAQMVPALRQLGVRIVQPALAVAMSLAGAVRYPTAFDVLLHGTDTIEIREITIDNSAFAQVPLRRLDLPGDALILSIRRNNTILIPDGHTCLQPQDSVALIGSASCIDKASQMLT
jgi:Kef-type K+ transport system membrane component KefB/Trk K+ transport system NAD-binding subunit